MKPSIVIHNDELPGSLEFARIAGIIETIADDSDVVDGQQFFEKNNVLQVSAYLFTTVPFWPQGTLFVSQVGQGRNIAVVLGNGSIILSPDNGTASMTIDAIGIKEAYVLADQSQYGCVRTGAELLNGKKLNELGQAIATGDIFIYQMPESVIEEGYAEGYIGMLLKTFGNITFTIKTADFEKTNIRYDDQLHVVIRRKDEVIYDEYMPYEPSFGYVPAGQPVVFNGSSGYMDIGLNQESFIATCIPEVLQADNLLDYKVFIRKVR